MDRKKILSLLLSFFALECKAQTSEAEALPTKTVLDKKDDIVTTKSNVTKAEKLLEKVHRIHREMTPLLSGGKTGEKGPRFKTLTQKIDAIRDILTEVKPLINEKETEGQRTRVRDSAVQIARIWIVSLKKTKIAVRSSMHTVEDSYQDTKNFTEGVMAQEALDALEEELKSLKESDTHYTEIKKKRDGAKAAYDAWKKPFTRTLKKDNPIINDVDRYIRLKERNNNLDKEIEVARQEYKELGGTESL